VDNNVWLVGDERDVIVVDAAHDAEAIATAVGDRRVLASCVPGHGENRTRIRRPARLSQKVSLSLSNRHADLYHEVRRKPGIKFRDVSKRRASSVMRPDGPGLGV